jgi:hypothetical protein
MKKHYFLFATKFVINATLFQCDLTRNEIGFSGSPHHKSLIVYNFKTNVVSIDTLKWTLNIVYRNFGAKFLIYVIKQLRKTKKTQVIERSLYQLYDILFNVYDLKLYKYYFKLTHLCDCLNQSKSDEEGDYIQSDRKFNLEQFILHVQYYVEHVKYEQKMDWIRLISSNKLIYALDKIYRNRSLVPENFIHIFLRRFKTIQQLKFLVEDLCSHQKIKFTFNTCINFNFECVQYLIQYPCEHINNVSIICKTIDDIKFAKKHNFCICRTLVWKNVLVLEYYLNSENIQLTLQQWNFLSKSNIQFFQYAYEHFDKTHLDLNAFFEKCNDLNVHKFIQSELQKNELQKNELQKNELQK